MDADEVAKHVAAAAAGDADAYGALVRQFGRLVWSITRVHGLRPVEAEDVSQVVWLRFVEHLGRLQDPGRAGAWLATTARRECLAVLRHRRRAEPAGIGGDHDGDLGRVHLDPDPAERLDAAERRAAVRAALAEVGEPCASLLQLLFVEPRPSYEEIGAALEMPVGSIGPTRARCLDKLRRQRALARISADRSDSDVGRSAP